LPTILTHSFVAIGSGIAFAPKDIPRRFWVLSLVSAIIPDADVISFRLGVPYGHMLGHRGFFHSPFFALLLSLFLVGIFLRAVRPFSRRWWFYVAWFFAVSAIHGCLDALTNGGSGVAFLAPFDSTRFFFPWRPIKVAPIGLRGLLSPWGMAVLKGEILRVWLPFALMVLILRVVWNRVSEHRSGPVHGLIPGGR
jgi:inner membrane protein